MLNTTQPEFSNTHISQNAKLPSNLQMDVRAIRLRNLQELVLEFGTLTAVADKADVSYAYLVQIRSKRIKREMGDDIARRLESGTGKEHGWMDNPHWPSAKEDHQARYGSATSEVAKGSDKLFAKIQLLTPRERNHVTAVVEAITSTRRRKKK